MQNQAPRRKSNPKKMTRTTMRVDPDENRKEVAAVLFFLLQLLIENFIGLIQALLRGFPMLLE